MAGDNRRVSNGDQVSRVATLALKRGMAGRRCAAAWDQAGRTPLGCAGGPFPCHLSRSAASCLIMRIVILPI